MHKIKCAHCKGIHSTARDVAICAHLMSRAQTNIANARTVIPAKRPNEWPFKTPEAMVRAIRDGRYAVSLNGGREMDDFTFIRVSRPKNGKKRGCTIVQTQHSDAYKEAIIFYPSGSFWVFNPRIDQQLLMVAADPFTSAMNYGQILDRCSRCAKSLTDAKSRWYSIGPECEKYWPEIVNYINETKGVFRG